MTSNSKTTPQQSQVTTKPLSSAEASASPKVAEETEKVLKFCVLIVCGQLATVLNAKASALPTAIINVED
ncbi:MAG: hypothetical protein RLZZ04_4890 [Cyanobacteriota bacterium]